MVIGRLSASDLITDLAAVTKFLLLHNSYTTHSVVKYARPVSRSR